MERKSPNFTDRQLHTEVSSSSSRRFIKHYEKYMLLIGIVGNFLFYLQAYRIFLTQSTRDVSTTGFIISFFSIMSWLIYGIIIKNRVLIIVNAFGLFGSLLTLVLIIILDF